MQKHASHRSSHLEEAIALLIQTQAAFVAQLAETRRENEKLAMDFKQQVQRLDRIEATLLRHERILADLPEAIRQKIGFQPS